MYVSALQTNSWISCSVLHCLLEWTQYLCVLAFVCVRDILPFLAGVCVELFPDVIKRDRWGFHLAFTKSGRWLISLSVSLSLSWEYTLLWPPFVILKTHTHSRFSVILGTFYSYLFWGYNILCLHICKDIHENINTNKHTQAVRQ